MKIKLLLGLSLFAILAMDCTSETDTLKSNDKITRIYVGTTDAKSRTSTDASTAEVTWKDGDEIAVFHVNGSGRSDYKRFLLSSGAGEQSAYFEGVTADDYLTAGESYKVIYPYSSTTYTNETTSNIYSFAIYEIPNTVDKLATYDWLYSATRVIPTDGTMPAFTLQHTMALIKVTLDIEGVEEYEDFDEYLKNITFAPTDNSFAFAQRCYWDTNLDFAIKNYGTTSVSYISNGQWLEDGTTSFWLPVVQNTNLGIQGLNVTVYVSHGTQGNTLWSATTTFTPTSLLVSGKIYPIHLRFAVDGTNRSGTLTIVN